MNSGTLPMAMPGLAGIDDKAGQDAFGMAAGIRIDNAWKTLGYRQPYRTGPSRQPRA